MQLYDKLISDFLSMESVRNGKILNGDTNWPDDSEKTVILRSDMALELGGERFPSFGSTLVTMDKELVPCDRITLIGPDITEIKEGEGVPFSRISLVRLDPSFTLQGQDLYSAIRKTEYTRYHFAPKGFMVRISPSRNIESIRISREAYKGGISFASVGAKMIDLFKEDKAVQAVHIIYITSPDFDYKAVEKLTYDGESITKTIDHIFKNVVMDCNACSLQEICDQVEGLKELHFGMQNAN